MKNFSPQRPEEHKVHKDFLLVKVLRALCAFAVISFFFLTPAHAAERESAYSRVMRTNILRCGYIPYSYLFKVDPNTGKMSGVAYDVVNEIGRLMSIKVEWTEELTWATVATAIQNGRVDAFCSGMWIDTQNGRVLGFTQPLYFNAVSAYGRAGETRFHKLEDLNNKAVRIVGRDGGTSSIVARQDFPQATLLSLPSGVSDGEQVEQLATKKADVIFYGDDFMMDIMQKNPGQYKDLFPGRKLRVYATALALPIDDPAIKNMFDNGITELKGSHYIDRILTKYAPPGSWLNNIP